MNIIVYKTVDSMKMTLPESRASGSLCYKFDGKETDHGQKINVIVGPNPWRILLYLMNMPNITHHHEVHGR